MVTSGSGIINKTRKVEAGDAFQQADEAEQKKLTGTTLAR